MGPPAEPTHWDLALTAKKRHALRSHPRGGTCFRPDQLPVPLRLLRRHGDWSVCLFFACWSEGEVVLLCFLLLQLEHH
eukprot:CAMPEP_0119477564 /NCGR_PEP_ID=MMETSP1344-20130328/7664_1 /TAXON_ID=236787 /ORGANISM="Florenciella parvula, Strain CCMP2471" /LENGTH=77 /DNA_ID=CAMNT_0007511595 /DNA_START=197 /DNA_END=430 /DNA_ORIENTATION=-